MKGSVKLIRNTKSVMKQMNSAAFKRIHEACLEVVNTTKETLSGPRHGKSYLVPGARHKHYTASAPGEPPAVATGQLRNSIRHTIEGGTFKKLVGRVGSDLMKAPWLEFGTSEILPRPFLKPSFEKARSRIRQILSRKWF